MDASPTCLHVKEKSGKILVVPSAGNTSRAFAEVSARTGMPVIAIVPKSSVSRIWTTTAPENQNSIFLIAVDCDYSDAIAISNEIVKLEGLIAEGGVKNVARRDGIGGKDHVLHDVWHWRIYLCTLQSGMEEDGKRP